MNKLATPILVLLCLVLCVNLIDTRTDYRLLQTDYKSYIIETDTELAELRQQIEQGSTEYLDEFTITYYCECKDCCGKADGITKSGTKVCDGVTVAVDPTVIPLGTYIYIEDIGYRVAQDTGKAIQGNRIDVYVPSHEQALKLGVKTSKVWRMKE